MVWLDRSIYTIVDTYSSPIFILSRYFALRFRPRFLKDDLVFVAIIFAVSISIATNASFFPTLDSDQILVLFLSDTTLKCLILV